MNSANSGDTSNSRATWRPAPGLDALRRQANRNELLHASLTAANVLGPDECKKIVERSQTLDELDGETADGHSPDVRRVTERVLPRDDSFWPWQRVLSIIADLNASHYRFEVDDLGCPQGPPRLLTYHADEAGRYRTHVDVGPGQASQRKLTWILQLSDPTDYEGGRLQLAHHHEPESQDQGALIVFPAYLAHEITEITAGTRHSIVGWVHGPSFR